MLFQLFEYVFRKVQESQKGRRFKGTHQLVVYVAADVLLDETINHVQKGMETLLVTSWEDCLEVNADKTTA